MSADVVLDVHEPVLTAAATRLIALVKTATEAIGDIQDAHAEYRDAVGDARDALGDVRLRPDGFSVGIGQSVTLGGTTWTVHDLPSLTAMLEPVAAALPCIGDCRTGHRW
jgi:hypothetical protein